MSSPATDTAGSETSSSASKATGAPTVAVLGNPNAGKSSIFNRLTGLSQKVGNYPGVTVEKKEGWLHVGERRILVVDLPGTYSLAARSPDELVAVDVLLGNQPGETRPDLVLHVADASNLERNLYLFTQLRELGVPVVLVLNMIDVARRRGLEIDPAELSERLGVPVVSTQGQKGIGIAELTAAIVSALDGAEENVATGAELISPELASGVDRLRREWSEGGEAFGERLHDFEILRALVDRGGAAERRVAEAGGSANLERLEAARAALEGERSLALVESTARYAWIERQLDGCVRSEKRTRPGLSERIDRWLTHRVFGLAIFAAIMIVLFQSIFTWASPAMDAVETAFGWLGAHVSAWLPEGAFRSLVVDGCIAGVGGVVVFLPQILILFLFVGILEDCGYMARAAFVMDRVMAKCGLSGKSFIPMLSGFACAIPGIMATRVIEDRRDRLATILVTPLMTCSARLPVYAILIGTFVPDTPLLGGVLGLQAFTLFALYVLGIIAAIIVAWLFKATFLRGERSTFLLELPSYKLPSPRFVAFRLYDRARAFLVRAGTIILAMTIVVWALSYFPRSSEVVASFGDQRTALEARAEAAPDAATRAAVDEDLAALDREEAGDLLRKSALGTLGRAVEPVFAPLGWDWRISMAALASFPAREVVVATLGTIYNLGAEEDETSEGLRARLRAARHDDTGEKVYTLPVAFSIMVFFALCCQCGATIATIKRETNSWRWAWFTFAYMTALAYVAALAVFQIGSAW